MSLDPDTLEQAKNNPVKFLMSELQNRKTGYFLDGDDRPCLVIDNDPDKKLQPLVDDAGRPSIRVRAFLRSVFRYITDETLHLGDSDIRLMVDYLVEEAFKGGRKIVRTQPAKEGDYNFLGILVFANLLRPKESQEQGPGNLLLKEIVTDERSQPRITWDAQQRSLVAELRTADLWRAINSPQIECQVPADKATLLTAINFFSRRLGELEEQFHNVGLNVVVSHKDSGSWVTITRRDDFFLPDQTVLVCPDGKTSSASVPSSDGKSSHAKALESNDDNRIEVEAPNPVFVA